MALNTHKQYTGKKAAQSSCAGINSIMDEPIDLKGSPQRAFPAEPVTCDNKQFPVNEFSHRSSMIFFLLSLTKQTLKMHHHQHPLLTSNQRSELVWSALRQKLGRSEPSCQSVSCPDVNTLGCQKNALLMTREFKEGCFLQCSFSILLHLSRFRETVLRNAKSDLVSEKFTPL